MWMAGVTMWTGRCPANCTMYSPRSVSTARMPAASSTWFSSISSLTIDFDLTTLLTLCSRAMSSTCRLASAASLAQSTVAPRAVIFRSNSTSSLSRLAMA